MIIEVYKDVSYVLDDDGYAQAENQDTVRKRFIKAWESLVDGYKARVLLRITPFLHLTSPTGYVHG
jgi:hypothetical protein